jgi:hypothetical protein
MITYFAVEIIKVKENTLDLSKISDKPIYVCRYTSSMSDKREDYWDCFLIRDKKGVCWFCKQFRPNSKEVSIADEIFKIGFLASQIGIEQFNCVSLLDHEDEIKDDSELGAKLAMFYEDFGDEWPDPVEDIGIG